MHTPMHWRTERGRYFQTHPLHATFHLLRACCWPGWLYWYSYCPQGEKNIRSRACFVAGMTRSVLT